MSGSMIISRREVPSDIVAAHGGSSIVQWKRLATGGMLHSDIESFEWTAVCLASDESSFVTGSEMYVDGGFVAT